jgi:hypothetical protein
MINAEEDTVLATRKMLADAGAWVVNSLGDIPERIKVLVSA